MFENNKIENGGKISIGLPSIVVGVLIALKHIGMTNISYWSIILFGIEVWFICVAIVFVLFMVFMLIAMIFSK